MPSKKEVRGPLAKVITVPKKHAKPEVKVGVVTLFGAPKWTPKGRADVARWLRRLSDKVRRGTKDLDPKFTATYWGV